MCFLQLSEKLANTVFVAIFCDIMRHVYNSRVASSGHHLELIIY